MSEMQYEADSIFFLSPIGFVFLLPAYLRAVLMDYEQSDLIPMTIVSALTPPEADDVRTYFERRIAGLNAQQRSVIRDFISFLRERHGGDFLPGELETVEHTLMV